MLNNPHPNSMNPQEPMLPHIEVAFLSAIAAYSKHCRNAGLIPKTPIPGETFLRVSVGLFDDAQCFAIVHYDEDGCADVEIRDGCSPNMIPHQKLVQTRKKNR
jgi:hypothetical protein